MEPLEGEPVEQTLAGAVETLPPELEGDVWAPTESTDEVIELLGDVAILPVESQVPETTAPAPEETR